MIRLKLLRNHALGKAGSFIEVPADRATYLVRVGAAVIATQIVEPKVDGRELAKLADKLKDGRIDEEIAEAIASPEFEQDLWADEVAKTKEEPKPKAKEEPKKEVKEDSKKTTKSKK